MSFYRKTNFTFHQLKPRPWSSPDEFLLIHIILYRSNTLFKPASQWHWGF